MKKQAYPFSYYSLLSIILVAFLLISSCTKCPEFYGSVSGHIIDGSTDQPAENIKIFLLDRGAKLDTINYQNEHVFIDSVFTDSNGYYHIDSIPPGNYSVVPYSPGMQINHIETSDSYDFSIVEGEDVTVDFKSTPLLMLNNFHTWIYVKNPPFSEEWLVRRSKWKHARRHWISFVPYFETVETPYLDGTNYGFDAHYGLTMVLYSVDNYFKIQVTYKAWVIGDHSNVSYETKNFSIYTPLGATPERVDWEYDWETGKVTRLQ